jgi:hypothetical protein
VTDTNESLEDLRKRIIFSWHVQRGTTVWAPWGPSGWSAVVIRNVKCKWATGMRVKPTTLKDSGKGKVPLGRLVKRDPAQKGKDRPAFPPTEVFAEIAMAEETARAEKLARKEEKEAAQRLTEEPQESPPEDTDDASVSERKRISDERLQELLGLLGDESTTDDW